MIKQITFKVKHNPEDSNAIRINGKGTCANVNLRRIEGWFIPDLDYSVTWKVRARGKWFVEERNCNMVVALEGKITYQVCAFPLSWMGKRLTRIVKVAQ